ncbi:hypothetical protein QJS10_CPA03g02356 [Acorus calamus]|uniref:CRAL-TRIO domain-containing protein n=1 Tax=Acorus calamus TaxID=4465 RepID=A0AAV9F4J0_ACOCL|nr:hypothetical protein QJS10_CPA03g02356 [Acorus calamus]
MTDKVIPNEQETLLDQLGVVKIQGRDKRGRKILRVTGKLFPARAVDEEGLKRYLEAKVYPDLVGRPFVIVYLHATVQRGENFPGVSSIRAIYEAIPSDVRENLEAVYFVHPGLQSRLFLATFGRFIFTGGLYGKVKYINRLEFLYEHMRKGEVEIPEFVYDHDEELEYRPLMDYGLESDHRRIYDAPAMDPASSMYSLRCIS